MLHISIRIFSHQPHELFLFHTVLAPNGPFPVSLSVYFGEITVHERQWQDDGIAFTGIYVYSELSHFHHIIDIRGGIVILAAFVPAEIQQASVFHHILCIIVYAYIQR